MVSYSCVSSDSIQYIIKYFSRVTSLWVKNLTHLKIKRDWFITIDCILFTTEEKVRNSSDVWLHHIIAMGVLLVTQTV